MTPQLVVGTVSTLIPFCIAMFTSSSLDSETVDRSSSCALPSDAELLDASVVTAISRLFFRVSIRSLGVEIRLRAEEGVMKRRVKFHGAGRGDTRELGKVVFTRRRPSCCKIRDVINMHRVFWRGYQGLLRGKAEHIYIYISTSLAARHVLLSRLMSKHFHSTRREHHLHNVFVHTYRASPSLCFGFKSQQRNTLTHTQTTSPTYKARADVLRGEIRAFMCPKKTPLTTLEGMSLCLEARFIFGE